MAAFQPGAFQASAFQQTGNQPVVTPDAGGFISGWDGGEPRRKSAPVQRYDLHADDAMMMQVIASFLEVHG